MYNVVWNVFYEALITFHFKRETGEERYQERGESALAKMKEWAVHSDWNWKNKLLLMQAEYYNTERDFERAVICYEASIKAARESKFVHEEALGSELAALFFLERGLREKARGYFEHAMGCYEKWGAFSVAKRIEDTMNEEFGSDFAVPSRTNDELSSSYDAAVEEQSKETSSRKRLMSQSG